MPIGLISPKASKPERINRVFKIPLSKSKGKVISAVDPLLCLTPERLGAFGFNGILVKSAY